MYTMLVNNETIYESIMESSPYKSMAIGIPLGFAFFICICICFCCGWHRKFPCCDRETKTSTESTTLPSHEHSRTPDRVDDSRPVFTKVRETPPRVAPIRVVPPASRAPPDRSSERRTELSRVPTYHTKDDDSHSCPKDICKQYSINLRLNRAYYNFRYNKCYCFECYSSTKTDQFTVAGSIYTVPRGWTRFGLAIDQAFADAKQIYKRWYTTFHGTSRDKLEVILRERFIPFPGDSLLSGETFKTHLQDKNHIYTSPSIHYASLPHMCPIHTAKINNQWYDVQVVLECKQNPEGITKQRGYKSNACPIISDDEIEWRTNLRSSVVPYGLLIRAKEHRCTGKCAAKHSS